MKEREKVRNKWIFAGLLLLLICSGIYGTIEGKKQNKQWMLDYQIFKNAEATANSRNYDQAVNLFQNLLKKDYVKNSLTINWELAKTLKLKGDNPASAEYYGKVREAYPAIVANQDYLYEYGEVLLNTQNYSEAEKYLQQLIKITTSDKYRQWATQEMERIKQMKA